MFITNHIKEWWLKKTMGWVKMRSRVLEVIVFKLKLYTSVAHLLNCFLLLLKQGVCMKVML